MRDEQGFKERCGQGNKAADWLAMPGANTLHAAEAHGPKYSLIYRTTQYTARRPCFIHGGPNDDNARCGRGNLK